MKTDSFVRFMLLFALAIIVFLMFAFRFNPLALFSSSPAYTPEPTLTLKEELEMGAYYACAQLMSIPSWGENQFVAQSNWHPITYPLPKNSVKTLGNNRYKVDLHVDFTLTHVDKSQISGKDLVTEESFHDQVFKCTVEYVGVEDGIEYWHVEDN